MKEGDQYQHVRDFLKHHHMGILSTVDEDGKPWGSAIYFIADEEFNFFFVTRVDTFKYQNLDKNSLAALTVADEEKQTTVQVTGKISKVPVSDYMDVVFNKLEKVRPKDDPNWAPPLEKVHKGNYIPLQLTPTKMQYANYKPFVSEVHDHYIEKII